MSGTEFAIFERLVKRGAATAREYAEERGHDRQKFAVQFTRLKQRGLIVRTGEKRDGGHVHRAADL